MAFADDALFSRSKEDAHAVHPSTDRPGKRRQSGRFSPHTGRDTYQKRTGIGAYDITADELLAGTDTAKTESKTAQAQMLILELLADGKRMPSAELEKAVNERGISSRTMRTAKSRIGDRLVTEKDGTAWVCYLRD